MSIVDRLEDGDYSNIREVINELNALYEVEKKYNKALSQVSEVTNVAARMESCLHEIIARCPDENTVGIAKEALKRL